MWPRLLPVSVVRNGAEPLTEEKLSAEKEKWGEKQANGLLVKTETYRLSHEDVAE